MQSFRRPPIDNDTLLDPLLELPATPASAVAGVSSEPDPSLNAFVSAAARLTGRPIALVALIDDGYLRIQAAHGLDAASRSVELPPQLALDSDPIDTAELALDPRWAEHPWLNGAPGVRACASIALSDDAHTPLGALCVLHTQRGALPAAQHEALATLAPMAKEMLTERRRTLRLAADRERLLDFARASGDWMWETDAELRYQWIAGAFESITGLAPDGMIGRPALDSPLLDAFGNPQAGRNLRALLEQRLAFTRVLAEMITPRGRLAISLSAVPVFGESGSFHGWRGTARDVTARLDAAHRARAQAELLQQLSEQAPGVIVQFRRDRHGSGAFQFEFVSERIDALFGLSKAELMADSQRLFDAIHGDDRNRVRDSLLIHERAMRPLQIEYRIVRPDGEERWMASSLSPQRQGDGSVVWRGFVADTTVRKTIELALRASEERWNLAADAAGIGVVQFDPATGDLQFDAHACASHGLRHPFPPYPLDSWLQSVHPDDRAAVQAALRQALAAGDRFDTRYRFLRPDGSQPWLEITARVRRDAQSRSYGVIGTCRDVTDQMATEILRREKEAAERANRTKSEFLSRVSHELRTPLNGILGFAQLMALDRTHPLAPDQQRRLEGVQRAGQHLLDLINDVLDISRIEQGDLCLNLQPVDAARAIASCLSLIQPLAQARSVQLPAPPAEPCWVRADARALEQVLMNLLSNAIKYNRQGGAVHLDLASRPGEANGRLTIAVRDEGEGLTMQQQAQLFQPFNRLGAERQRIEGSGLGLVIARQLVEAMQGSLTVGSRPGAGSTFAFTLEAAPAAEAAAAPATHAPSPAAAPDAGDGQSRQVLYIEDEPLNAVLMQELFETLDDWTLHIARDGEQGLAMARTMHPDLLLIDMNLPDMTGIEVLRRLRSQAGATQPPCVALTANAMREQIEAARAAGFDDYWTKPVDMAQMAELLSGVLRARGTPSSALAPT